MNKKQTNLYFDEILEDYESYSFSEVALDSYYIINLLNMDEESDVMYNKMYVDKY